MNSHIKRYTKQQEWKGFVKKFDHRKQVFRFEHKVFLLNIEDIGLMVSIKEMNRQRNYSIRIDFGGVGWLIAELNKAKQRFGEGRAFSKYQATYALFLLQRYNNKNGSYELIYVTTRSGDASDCFSSGQGWRRLDRDCVLA
ncbi:hypothetical protein LguiA_026049 [Lonicera macranthoides]